MRALPCGDRVDVGFGCARVLGGLVSGLMRTEGGVGVVGSEGMRSYPTKHGQRGHVFSVVVIVGRKQQHPRGCDLVCDLESF